MKMSAKRLSREGYFVDWAEFDVIVIIAESHALRASAASGVQG
jgi:hypothetical protein